MTQTARTIGPILWLGALILGAATFADITPVEQPLILSLKEVAHRDTGRRVWELLVRTPDKCACSRCELENSLEKKGNEFVITIGKVVPPLDCLEPTDYPKTVFELGLEDQREYFVIVNGERHRLQVTREFAELRPVKTRLTKAESTKSFRLIPNLVSLVCFRYTYACDKKRKVRDELCPRLFAAMGRLAKEADAAELAKTGQVLDCTEEYRKKKRCRLYTFEGNLKELKTLYDNANSYRLTQGLESQCEAGNPPLYYKKFRTWDEQEVCC